MEQLTDILGTIGRYASEFLDADVRFHPFYILPFLLLGGLLYARHRRTSANPKGFFGWLFPKSVYLHPSHMVDIKLFFVGRVMTIFKFFNAIFVQTGFAVLAMGLLTIFMGAETSDQPLTAGRVLAATFVLTVVADFCVYWVHRAHHEFPVFWPFHSVHHSAEVLTPVTVYRKHPIYDFFSALVKAALLGFVQGIILKLLLGQVQYTLIGGINAVYFLFNALGSNFRHTHIWFSYGPALEHIFISPAQHQIHHSLEPRHHNKNYGEILALWDWMFGSLYVPKEKEELRFGIAESTQSNVRIEQPHPTLKGALITPFVDSWKAFKTARQNGKDASKDIKGIAS